MLYIAVPADTAKGRLESRPYVLFGWEILTSVILKRRCCSSYRDFFVSDTLFFNINKQQS